MERQVSVQQSASDYILRLPQVTAAVLPEDVTARKGNKAAWPILIGVSIAQVEIPVGKWRAPHYHTNAPELSVIIRGAARAGLITPQNDLLVADLQEGDCVYFPMGWTHWLRNTGQDVLLAYFNYGQEQPVTVEVSNIVAHFQAAEKDLPLKGRLVYTETE
jgi:oxalate decarboxylase/phosphoglucose isomerase-like protein (cupin superfamily)